MSDHVRLELRDALPSVAEPTGPPGTVSRKMLLKGALAGGALLAGGAVITGLSQPDARGAPSAAMDAKILNFLLGLEYLQAAFYAEAAASGALSGELQQFADVVGPQEAEHVKYMQARLKGRARPEPTFDFTDAIGAPDRFQATALLLEETTSAAYIGQGANLTAGRILAAARIASVEARHAAWIRDILGRLPAPQAADPAKSQRQVEATIRKTGFVRS
jgi:Ferritin-like domain